MMEPMIYYPPSVFICDKGHESAGAGLQVRVVDDDKTRICCLFCLRDWMVAQGWIATIRSKP